MTNEEKITLASKPVGEWTNEEAAFIAANKTEFRDLYWSPEVQALVKERRKTQPCNMGGVDDHITHASGRMKTVCTSTVLGYLGIPVTAYKYGGHREEFNGILNRNGFGARSRNSKVFRKGRTMGAVRKAIAGLNEPAGCWFTVRVERHILLVDHTGKTVVDTDPRRFDRRKVKHVDIVRRKA